MPNVGLSSYPFTETIRDRENLQTMSNITFWAQLTARRHRARARDITRRVVVSRSNHTKKIAPPRLARARHGGSRLVPRRHAGDRESPTRPKHGGTRRGRRRAGARQEGEIYVRPLRLLPAHLHVCCAFWCPCCTTAQVARMVRRLDGRRRRRDAPLFAGHEYAIPATGTVNYSCTTATGEP